MTCHVASSINVRCSLVVTKEWKGQLLWVDDMMNLVGDTKPNV